MTSIHSSRRAQRMRCAVSGCKNPGTQHHHLIYGGKREWHDPKTPFAVVLVCAVCHGTITDLEKRLGLAGEYVPLPVLTAQYIINPELTISWASYLAPDRPPGVSDEQLSWGDWAGPSGNYWRNWMLSNGYPAPPHRPYEREEIAARDGDTLDDAA